MKAANELVKVVGRNPVLLVEYEDGDYFHKIGDTIYYQQHLYEVVGVEMQKLMMSPPKISNRVGLALRFLR